MPPRVEGRAPTARRKAALVRKLRAEGMKAVEIAERAEISRASVYRALNNKASVSS